MTLPGDNGNDGNMPSLTATSEDVRQRLLGASPPPPEHTHLAETGAATEHADLQAPPSPLGSSCVPLEGWILAGGRPKLPAMGVIRELESWPVLSTTLRNNCKDYFRSCLSHHASKGRNGAPLKSLKSIGLDEPPLQNSQGEYYLRLHFVGVFFRT